MDSFSTADKVCLALTSSLLNPLKIGKFSLTKKNIRDPIFDWRLNNFSTLDRDSYTSGSFSSGGRNWWPLSHSLSTYVYIHSNIQDMLIYLKGVYCVGYWKCIQMELDLERIIRCHSFCWVRQMKKVTWKPSYELLTRADPTMWRNKVGVSVWYLLSHPLLLDYLGLFETEKLLNLTFVLFL